MVFSIDFNSLIILGLIWAVALFPNRFNKLYFLPRLLIVHLPEFILATLIICVIFINYEININLISVLFIITSSYIIFVKLLFNYYLFVVSNKLGESSIYDVTKFVFNFKFLSNFFKNFQQFLQLTLDDIKVGLFFFEGVNLIKIISDDLYNLQKEFFKYITPTKLEDSIKYSSNDDLAELNKRLGDLKNPTIKFNKLSRLPLKFEYNHEELMVDNFFFIHVLTIYTFFKTTLVSVLLCFIYFLFSVFFFKIQFLKQLSVWFVIGMMFFWLISGFNFFIKRYQFGKFTSQIQRFWKRTNTCFWLIEGFLLLLFFYYYINSSQEPLFMYDYSFLNQEYLISLYTIGFNTIILSLVIFLMYFTLLRLNSNSWEQLSLNLLVISFFIFFSFFIETYQFYYVISVFNERLWLLNEEENIWSIETDNPILRTKTQYFLVCLIAKYWHFLFIFLSWVFFLMKSFERKKITYVLFGSNLQNVILLFVLNLACYIQWLKWIYRRFLDLPYTWFFTNIDNKLLYKIFCEFKLLYSQLLTFNTQITSVYSITFKSLSLWSVDSLFLWKFI